MGDISLPPPPFHTWTCRLQNFPALIQISVICDKCNSTSVDKGIPCSWVTSMRKRGKFFHLFWKFSDLSIREDWDFGNVPSLFQNPACTKGGNFQFILEIFYLGIREDWDFGNVPSPFQTPAHTTELVRYL